MRELQKKELLLPKNTIKNEDQSLGPDSGLTILILVTELIDIMDRIIRAEDDHLIDGQMTSPTEVIEIVRITEITVTKMKLGEVMENFRVCHHNKLWTFHRGIHFANSSLLNLGITHLEDQTVNQPPVPLLVNKNFCKALINHRRMWFA